MCGDFYDCQVDNYCVLSHQTKKQPFRHFLPHIGCFFSVTAGLQSQHDLEPMLGISAVYDIIGIQE